MVISSFFPGRIRIRDKVFRDSEISQSLRAAIEWHDAIKKIEHNLTTGSVLIEYAPEKLPVSALSALSGELLSLKKLCDRYNLREDETLRSQILGKIAELKEKLVA